MRSGSAVIYTWSVSSPLTPPLCAQGCGHEHQAVVCVRGDNLTEVGVWSEPRPFQTGGHAARGPQIKRVSAKNKIKSNLWFPQCGRKDQTLPPVRTDTAKATCSDWASGKNREEADTEEKQNNNNKHHPAVIHQQSAVKCRCEVVSEWTAPWVDSASSHKHTFNLVKHWSRVSRQGSPCFWWSLVEKSVLKLLHFWFVSFSVLPVCACLCFCSEQTLKLTFTPWLLSLYEVRKSVILALIQWYYEDLYIRAE